MDKNNQLSAKQLEKMLNQERKVYGNSAQYQRLFRLWNEALEREYTSNY
jgi:hypothetical protein